MNIKRPQVAFVLAAVGLSMLLAHQPAGARERTITLVAAGDINLNRHREQVHEDGVMLWGKLVPFADQLKGIADYIDGDINFCNLETTVMDHNKIPPSDKTYNFRTHPNAVRHLQKIGFNVMAIANNHMIDYGEEGITETLKWLDKLGKEKPLWYAGAGENIDKASDIAIFEVKGVRIAFGAVSISKAAGKKTWGVASVHNAKPVLEKLKNAKADIKILSMHAGTEKDSKPVGIQFQVARSAIEQYDVDIVLGHHAHVPQGVEYYKGGIIFYGLGNFSMRGARNMGAAEFRNVRDFGILGKVVMKVDDGKVTFVKVEVLPVYDMHSNVHPFEKDDSAKTRIESVNLLSSPKYLGPGKQGLVFAFRKGRGVVEFNDKGEPIIPEDAAAIGVGGQSSDSKPADDKKKDEAIKDKKKEKDKEIKKKDKKKSKKKKKDKKKRTSTK